jgi:hypothetical protein
MTAYQVGALAMFAIGFPIGLAIKLINARRGERRDRRREAA